MSNPKAIGNSSAFVTFLFSVLHDTISILSRLRLLILKLSHVFVLEANQSGVIA